MVGERGTKKHGGRTKLRTVEMAKKDFKNGKLNILCGEISVVGMGSISTSGLPCVSEGCFVRNSRRSDGAPSLCP